MIFKYDYKALAALLLLSVIILVAPKKIAGFFGEAEIE